MTMSMWVYGFGAGRADGTAKMRDLLGGKGANLAEMTRLGVAAGAHPLTFAGLAGVGDLIATCMSPLSRNRRAGELMGSGLTWTDAAPRPCPCRPSGVVRAGVRGGRR